jgi:hypothetical protein
LEQGYLWQDEDENDWVVGIFSGETGGVENFRRFESKSNGEEFLSTIGDVARALIASANDDLQNLRLSLNKSHTSEVSLGPRSVECWMQPTPPDKSSSCSDKCDLVGISGRN